MEKKEDAPLSHRKVRFTQTAVLKVGKIFSPATAGCNTGLPGFEPDVSRRSSCSGKLCSEGALDGTHAYEESAWDSLQCRGNAYLGRSSSPGAAGGDTGISGLEGGLPPLPPESNTWPTT